jgi:LemA protein
MIWIGLLTLALVSLSNRVDAAWADIDVQLKRRYDVVPNLVEVVKGYAAHERGTLEKVAAASTAAMARIHPPRKRRPNRASCPVCGPCLRLRRLTRGWRRTRSF